MAQMMAQQGGGGGGDAPATPEEMQAQDDAKQAQEEQVGMYSRTFLDPDAKVTDRNKVPARPFVGDLVTLGSEEQKRYVPSLDPVRMPGKVSRTTDK